MEVYKLVDVYRSPKAICQHCAKNGVTKMLEEVYVLEKENGDILRVGSTCVNKLLMGSVLNANIAVKNEANIIKNILTAAKKLKNKYPTCKLKYRYKKNKPISDVYIFVENEDEAMDSYRKFNVPEKVSKIIDIYIKDM